MDGVTDPRDPERLLEQTGWMRSLARTLVADEARADDIVQDTLLAAVERPPDANRSFGAWLARVLRNRARRSHRDSFRRERRERMAARPDRVSTTPADLVERAEIQRRIAGAVIDLEEPYRSTVLLKFFEEMGSEEIARRMGIPAATVRTRLHRAMERLRLRLDREYGGERARWSAIILPFLGADALAPSATAGAAGASGLVIGGIIMTQKIAAGAALIGAVSLVAGLAVGFAVKPGGPSEEEIAARYVERAEHDALRERNDALVAELARVKKERAGIAKRCEDLQAQVADFDRKLRDQEEVARAAAAPDRRSPVSFGKWADLEAIRDTDWKEMGLAAHRINELLSDMIRRMKNGEPIDVDFQKKVTEENNKLVQYAAGLMGKIPTNAPLNGEFSHPISLANLMGGMLETAGVPLTASQIADFEQLGIHFEEEYARRQADYSEDTPRLGKIIDEMDLKRDCVGRMQALLTPEQREAIIDPEIHDRVQLDVISPATMATLVATPTDVGSLEEFRKGVADRAARDFQIDVEADPQAKAILDRYCRDVEPLLAEPANPKEPLRLDSAIAAGRAQAQALEGILGLPNLTEKARNAALAMYTWSVPRRVEREGDAAPE
ncbi:MAG: sigma-70 family RNA polymerase sigma factor [Planctomycetes bacterium]|nr:sigma-70 family RNA polymerase sigma factor [Planctomycetota bacterium]